MQELGGRCAGQDSATDPGAARGLQQRAGGRDIEGRLASRHCPCRTDHGRSALGDENDVVEPEPDSECGLSRRENADGRRETPVVAQGFELPLWTEFARIRAFLAAEKRESCKSSEIIAGQEEYPEEDAELNEESPAFVQISETVIESQPVVFAAAESGVLEPPIEAEGIRETDQR